MRIFFFCSALFLCSCVLSVADSFELVRENKGLVAIKLPEHPTPSERLAQQELISYLKKISGAEVPEIASKTILIGTPDRLEKLPEKIQSVFRADLQNDTFYLFSTESVLYIIGNRSFAALAGTYEFIEKYLGVRWFYPGELGEYYPRMDSISLPAIDDCQTAHFQFREFNICGTSKNFRSSYDWMARNKLYSNGPHSWQLPGMSDLEKQEYRQALGALQHVGGHEFFRQAVPKELFEAQPELFALQNGQRRWEGRVNRCLANPEVIRRSAEYYLQSFRNNPNRIGVFIGEDDSKAFCECPLCQQMGTFNETFSYSNLFHLFFQKIADQILLEFPQANLEFFAYWNYRPVPENPSIHYPSPNSYVLYAAHQRCYAHPFNADEPCNRKFFQELIDWKGRCAKLGFYDYRYDSRCYYAPFEEVVASDLKTFHQLGMVKWTDETLTGEGNSWGDNPNREILMRSNWQSHYVSAKLLWDSSLQLEDILQDAYQKYYGKAAPAMQQYHALRQQLWKNAPGHCVINGPERTASCLNTPGSEPQLLELLAEAEQLADSDILKQRIAFDRHCLKVFWQEPAEKLRQQRLQNKDLQPQPVLDPIQIDSQFNEQTWLKAQPIEGFFVPEIQKEASEKTMVRVAYDDEHLYLAINAENKNAWSPVKAEAKSRDGAVWEDDSIEIQIAPPDLDGQFFHFVINTKGVFYDAAVYGNSGDRNFDSQAEVCVGFEKQSYFYEIKIPLAPMRAKIDFRPWQFHVMRTVTNLQPPNSSEWSSFDGVRPFQTDRFRLLVFGKNLIQNGNFAELQPQEWTPGKATDFPKHWELAGRSLEHFRVETSSQGSKVWTSGTLFTGVPVPKEQAPESQYIFVVRACGKGSISARTWSWQGYQPRSNHRHLQLEKFPLSEGFQDYYFKVPYLLDEAHMIFYIDGLDKTVQNVSCTLNHN